MLGQSAVKTPEYARSYFSELCSDDSKFDEARENQPALETNRLYSMVSDLHKIF